MTEEAEQEAGNRAAPRSRDAEAPSLEARVAALQEEADRLERLNRAGIAIAGERDVEKVVQAVTDAGVALSKAAFGAFFYNAAGEAYTLGALSGTSRDAFAGFPMPRDAPVFEATFHGAGPVRSDDITADARFGPTPVCQGMPPVRSYLAVPVVSRSGEVLGGLFFGHPDAAVFTERAERWLSGLAAQAALAIDNARLHQTSSREIAAREAAEQALHALNDALEQRAAERARELAASDVRLEEIERGFRLLVEAVTDYAIFMLDPTGHVVNWNQGAERIKGYDRTEIVGQHFSRFYDAADLQAGKPAQALERATRTGKFLSEGWRVRKDGSRFWASVVINAIRAPDGALLGFAKVTRDLTERRAAEERLRHAQKMEGIGQLTGGVAHDFNNLLMAVLGNLDLLRKHVPDNPRVARLVEGAVQGAQRGAALTQRLLAFSRRQELQIDARSVTDLVHGMTDLLQRSVGPQIELVIDLPATLPPAMLDSNQMELALLNLAVNARDAMPDGGTLSISADRVDAALDDNGPRASYVRLIVGDTGHGMDADTLEKATEPFFTTKELGKGTGLGLSMVHGLAVQLNGALRLSSQVGRGTRAELWLPMAAGASVPVAPPASDAPGDLVPRAIVILLVDDDALVAMSTVEMLVDLGHEVIEASSGARALEILETGRSVDLLITDYSMPKMTGVQLARAARMLRPDLPILLASGYAELPANTGVDLPRLRKPYQQTQLAQEIARTLQSAAR